MSKRASRRALETLARRQTSHDKDMVRQKNATAFRRPGSQNPKKTG